jgi:hypothetical protein
MLAAPATATAYARVVDERVCVARDLLKRLRVETAADGDDACDDGVVLLMHVLL